MVHEALLRRYISAWNSRDSAALLELMHSGAAYYDGFWREACVGRDLRQYFEDAFVEEPYRYEQIGEAFGSDDSVILRYEAYSEDDALLYSGAEILTVQEGKILTVTDIYCNPDQAVLEELATLESRRHGGARYANAGLGAMRSLRLGARFSELEARKRGFRRSQLTVGELADRLDCSVDQLIRVVELLYGYELTESPETLSMRLARELVERKSATPSSKPS